MEKNCIEILRPFGDALEGVKDVQIVGGIGSLALSNPESRIDMLTNTIVAPPDFYIPSRRANKTVRDVDVMVATTDQARINQVVDTLRETVGDEMERSVFGLQKYERLQAQAVSPLGFRAISAVVSDRYEKPNGELFKAVFPFAVPMDPLSLETWTLDVNGVRLPVPHPGMMLINYSQRSIAGLRGKDRGKLFQVRDKVYSEAPEIKGWIMDGPGATQAELTKIINSLAQRKRDDNILPETGYLTRAGIARHEAFLVRDNDDWMVQRATLAIAAFKAVNLARLEANGVVVDTWQSLAGSIEKHFSGAKG